MKLSEAIERVKKEKPHSYSDDHCTLFITEVEAIVQDFLRIPVYERIKYEWEKDGNTELIVPAPYDSLYISWLKAKIDYCNEEYESYANNQDHYNADMQAFKAWAIREGEVESTPVKIRNWW